MPVVDDLVLPARPRPQQHTACQPNWRHKLGLRRTDKPVFEGAWSCSASCLQSRLATAIKRETGEGRGVSRYYQHRVPLGLLLLQQGAITQQELQQVLEAQRIAGKGRLGEWLRAILHLDEITVARCIARQWNCSIFSVDDLQPQRMVSVAPRQLLIHANAVPLRMTEEGRMQLAFREHLDAALALAIERMNGVRVEKGLLLPREFEEAQRYIFAESPIPVFEHRAADIAEVETILFQAVLQSQPSASRLVRVHSIYWLRMWFGNASLAQKAHDVLVHIA